MDKGYKTFLFSYGYQNSRWQFEIAAKSEQEARERVALLQYAQYDGELMATIPAKFSWIAKFICWVNR